jgi:uncharacterized protein (TIGR02147 family)
MKHKRTDTPIFIYEDYVDFLQAWYRYARRFGLTQREFMKKARIKAQSFFSDVLSGRKKLGEGHIKGFITALELSDAEAEYFNLLVIKEITRDIHEKEALLRKLAFFREKHLSAVLSDGTLEYFSAWKYPVIREYIKSKGVVRSSREIAGDLLHLKLSSADIKSALNKLCKWNLITFDEKLNGYRSNPAQDIITYKEMPHAVVNDVKRSLIESSIHAMETLDKDERHVSMAIRGLDKESYGLFCAKIDALRKEFLEHDTGKNTDRILSLNIQLYPIMKICRPKVPEARE